MNVSRDGSEESDMDVPPVLRKTRLVPPLREIGKEKEAQYTALFLEALHRVSSDNERHTSGIHTVKRWQESDVRRLAFAAQETIADIPKIRRNSMQECPPEYSGAMIEYQAQKPGYLALTGAIIQCILTHNTLPKYLIISSNILKYVESEIIKIDGSYDGMFLFRTDAIPVMTENDIPVWLSSLLENPSRNIVYAIV